MSWLWYWQLHLFEYDCGLAFGSTTLVAHAAGANGPKLLPWKVGSRRWIRFPVHTAFFGMFFLLPTMTTDLLVLAIVANIYNVIGSVLYDLRLINTGAASYRTYMAVTGLIWPPIYRAPQGAKEITMPAPSHWRRPVMHLPGLIAGVVLGFGYLLVIGPTAVTPLQLLLAGGAGLAGAVLVGGALGFFLRPAADTWAQQQTDLSTTVALAAAVGVVTWASAWVGADRTRAGICCVPAALVHGPILGARLRLPGRQAQMVGRVDNRSHTRCCGNSGHRDRDRGRGGQCDQHCG